MSCVWLGRDITALKVMMYVMLACESEWMNEYMDGLVDAWMDRWMDGQVEGWMNG